MTCLLGLIRILILVVTILAQSIFGYPAQVEAPAREPVNPTPPKANGTRPAPMATHRTANPPVHTLTGTATWFRSPAGVSAAGPALRRAIGPHWRGAHVLVCSGSRCVRTVLGDWCACGAGRVIDLDDNVFRRLAPLGRGVLREVTITW